MIASSPQSLCSSSLECCHLWVLIFQALDQRRHLDEISPRDLSPQVNKLYRLSMVPRQPGDALLWCRLLEPWQFLQGDSDSDAIAIPELESLVCAVNGNPWCRLQSFKHLICRCGDALLSGGASVVRAARGGVPRVLCDGLRQENLRRLGALPEAAFSRPEVKDLEHPGVTEPAQPELVDLWGAGE